jgi:acyl-coenzyme A synthetase/AMP-(fatty) acid ligase
LPSSALSVLIEHPAVAEATVIPSPDPLRLAVPKALVGINLGDVIAEGEDIFGDGVKHSGAP